MKFFYRINMLVFWLLYNNFHRKSQTRPPRCHSEPLHCHTGESRYPVSCSPHSGSRVGARDDTLQPLAPLSVMSYRLWVIPRIVIPSGAVLCGAEESVVYADPSISLRFAALHSGWHHPHIVIPAKAGIQCIVIPSGAVPRAVEESAVRNRSLDFTPLRCVALGMTPSNP